METNQWQLQDAKNKFSTLVNQAKNSPQFVTKHGKKTVVVLSMDEYDKLLDSNANMAEFFLSSPLQGADLDLKRNKDTKLRDIEL